MFMAGTLVALAAALVWRGWHRRERPFDREELLVVRGYADRVRRDQIHPFE